MPFGFLCCGPTTLHNVVDTSDEEDSDNSSYGVRVSGVHLPDDPREPRGGSGQRRRPRRGVSGGGASSSEEEEEEGFIARMTSVNIYLFKPHHY